MTKSVFSKLCNKHGGYVNTTGHGYDEYVVYDKQKNMTGGGSDDLDNVLEFFGGRLSPQSFAGVYTGGKKSKNNGELDNFMAYLQGKGDALVAGDIAGAKALLSSKHLGDRNEINDDNDE